MLYNTPFNGPSSRTTRVSRYQKGKTNLDFTGARDSDWQWNHLGHMQVCTSLQTDNHASTPPLSFLQAGCPSCRPTKALKEILYCLYCKVNCVESMPILTADGITCEVSKICLMCSTLVSRQVYLTKLPSGTASRRTNDIEVFGSRFFRPLTPTDIRCCRQSKNVCGMWKTRGSGLPTAPQQRQAPADEVCNWSYVTTNSTTF